MKKLVTLLVGILIMLTTSFSATAEQKFINIKITTGEHTLNAKLIDNATTQALIQQFPLTIPMLDLYGREMCYRFAQALPANEAATSGYEVGDIAYWPPRHSFIIMYAQNGERINQLQKVGHIDTGVEIFKQTGDTLVTFELDTP